MKQLILCTTLALLGAVAVADTSTTDATKEQATKELNNAKRAAKKAGHRAQEAVCDQGDEKCLAEKAKNHAKESYDYSKDKVDEAKQKLNDQVK